MSGDERTVKVRLLAIHQQYMSAFAQAGRSTEDFARTAVTATGRTATSLRAVKTEATIAGAALLGVGFMAVRSSTMFDKQMSNVRAVSNATADEMGKLRQAALDAGQATVFSASEAAQAEAELAKAGVATADILGGALRGSLDLAAASGLDLAASTTIAAQAMNVFDLRGREVSHVADVLAAGANKSAADVGQLGDALRQGGLVAKQTGLGLEDTVGTLAAFADNALVGSDAGTSLKTMLMRLTPQSQEAATAIQTLGIEAYDAQGNFVGMEKFAGSLQAALAKLSPEARSSALNVIFGSDAARAAGVIYELGAEGIREYTDAVNDQGAASRMAGIQLDNLAGDVEQLSGSIETTFIKSGTEANDLLRAMTQAATGAVNFIGDLPAPILATGLAVTTLSGAFFVAAPRIAQFNAQLATTPGLAKAAKAGLIGIGAASAIAIGAGVVLDIQAAHKANDELKASIGDLISQLEVTGVKTDLYDQLVAKANEAREQLVDPGFIKKVETWGEALAAALHPDSAGLDAEYARIANDLAPAYRSAGDALGTLNSAVGNAAGILGIDFDRALQLANDSGVQLTGTSADMTAQIVAYASAQSGGSAAAHTAAAAMDILSDSTASAEDRLKAFKNAWDATVGVMLASSDAAIAAEAAIDDLTAALKKNGDTWNINTEKGRANQSAYNDVIAAAGRAAQAKLDEGKSTDVANATYDRYLRKLLKAKGITDEQRAAVKRLINEGYAKLPPKVETKVTADTSQANAAIATLQGKLTILKTPIGIRVAVTSSGDVLGRGSSGGGKKPPGTATGGHITGPGTATSDNLLLRVSPNEFVMQSAAVDRWGLPFMSAVNRGDKQAAMDAAFTERLHGRGRGGDTYNVTVTAAPGERAAETVPRALRSNAFRTGVGG